MSKGCALPSIRKMVAGYLPRIDSTNHSCLIAPVKDQPNQSIYKLMHTKHQVQQQLNWFIFTPSSGVVRIFWRPVNNNERLNTCEADLQKVTGIFQIQIESINPMHPTGQSLDAAPSISGREDLCYM